MEIHVVLLCETVDFAFAPNFELCYGSIYLPFCTTLIEMSIFFSMYSLVLINCNCKLLETNIWKQL